MSIRKTPFPKPSFRSFIRVLSAISATIVFILVVFQPFGTASFNHPAKYLMLLGYGVVTLLSGILFYFVTTLFISDHRLNRWSIVDEIVFLFFTIMICQVSCYLYWTSIFADGLNWTQFVVFFRIASLTSFVPITVYLLFIYQKYKEVKFLTTYEKQLAPTSSVDKTQLLNITGGGKNEKINVAKENLLLVKSEDNYVILFLKENDKIVKRMMRNTLSDIEDQIGSSFLRCHRSYIINPSKITDIEGNITNTKITLTNVDTKIPVSRAMVDKVKSFI